MKITVPQPPNGSIVLDEAADACPCGCENSVENL